MTKRKMTTLVYTIPQEELDREDREEFNEYFYSNNIEDLDYNEEIDAIERHRAAREVITEITRTDSMVELLETLNKDWYDDVFWDEEEEYLFNLMDKYEDF